MRSFIIRWFLLIVLVGILLLWFTFTYNSILKSSSQTNYIKLKISSTSNYKQLKISQANHTLYSSASSTISDADLKAHIAKIKVIPSRIFLFNDAIPTNVLQVFKNSVSDILAVESNLRETNAALFRNRALQRFYLLMYHTEAFHKNYLYNLSRSIVSQPPVLLNNLKKNLSLSDYSTIKGFLPSEVNSSGALINKDGAAFASSERSSLTPQPKNCQSLCFLELLNSFSMMLCPINPLVIRGLRNLTVKEDMNLTVRDSLSDVRMAYWNLAPGGRYHPPKCIARHRVAIIIPYRDREYNLFVLLSHLHPVLQRQHLDYRIFVIEQYGNDTFNKGRLMNIGFSYASRQSDFQCFIFHDVDLISEDDRNVHTCAEFPRHMSVALDEYNYKLPYADLVGGVFVIPKHIFIKVNGYSNSYWGWGAEDDDMAVRMKRSLVRIIRPPTYMARYRALPHTKWKRSSAKIKYKLLMTAGRRFRYDGLNNLQYRLISVTNHLLYSKALVEIGPPPKLV